MLDLKPEYLEILRKIFAKHIPDMNVLAYGSRINGQSHEGSDLDLVVVNPKDSSFPQAGMAALHAAISESNIPILIDILDWARIPASFQEKIKEGNVEIWGRKINY